MSIGAAGIRVENKVRTKRPHLERQQQIVEAARKIITHRGMEHLTVRALAESLDLSQAALYRHVRSRQAILMLVLQDIETTLLHEVGEAQKGKGSALERLMGTLNAHLSYSERRRGVGFLVINEALRNESRELRSRAGALVESYLESIKKVLLDGQQEGGIRDDIDVEVAARLFFGMVQSNVTLWALQSHAFPLGGRQEELWELYRAGVSSNGKSGKEVQP